MRKALEGLALRYWSDDLPAWGRLPLTLLAAPLSALFGAGVRLRARGYETGLLASRAPGIPVISVGNLSVGGSGKTPVTRWVAASLQARGVTPGVVSRGYGGDEVALHRRWFPGLPVESDPDRVAAAERARSAGAGVVVVDDGFQHRALERDADIVLVAEEDPFPPRLLPRGPYREPLGALGRASLVLVTSRREGPGLDARLADLRRIPRHPPVAGLRLVPGPWETLNGSESPPLPHGASVLVVTSVARPLGVLETLASVRAGDPEPGEVELMAWPDHHPYDRRDVEAIVARARERIVVTTAKDAVKLLPFQALFPEGEGAPRVLALEVEPSPDATRLLGKVLDRVVARGSTREGE